jgi:tetratricopeptide (TPR) repeat protein
LYGGPGIWEGEDRQVSEPRRPSESSGARRGQTRPSGGGRPARHPPHQERAPRPSGPALPDEIADVELDPSVRAELRSLGKPLADEIAAHVLAAGLLIDADPVAALAHARYARSRAGRIGAVREAAGVTAYAAGEYAEALAELRAARRMTGDPSVLAMIADSERALGRPERALRASDDPQLARLDRDEQIEVFLVVAGARRDLGQLDAALATLQRAGVTADPAPGQSATATARLVYAYADLLAEMGRSTEAKSWFERAAAVDEDGATDAVQRVREIDG